MQLLLGKLEEEETENLTEISDEEEADEITGLKKSKYMLKTEFSALMKFIENFK